MRHSIGAEDPTIVEMPEKWNIELQCGYKVELTDIQVDSVYGSTLQPSEVSHIVSVKKSTKEVSVQTDDLNLLEEVVTVYLRASLVNKYMREI